jgi:hypothetical protein
MQCRDDSPEVAVVCWLRRPQVAQQSDATWQVEKFVADYAGVLVNGSLPEDVADAIMQALTGSGRPAEGITLDAILDKGNRTIDGLSQAAPKIKGLFDLFKGKP